MSTTKLGIYSHVLVGIAVILVSLTIEKLLEEISVKAYFWTVALTVLSIVITALIGRVNHQSLDRAAAEATSEAIKAAVEARLESHMKAIAELSEDAARAAVYLQASNSGSDLRKILITAEDIRGIEKAAREKIFVVTRDLAFDIEIDRIVSHNLRHNKEYYYFYPDGTISETDINKFKDHLALDPESLKGVKMVAIPKSKCNFPTDLVVYDPHKHYRTGYARLPIDGLPGGLRAIFLQQADPLRDLSESLFALIKEYPPRTAPDENGQR